MTGICEGCEQEGFVTEYIYIDTKQKAEKQGVFCIECMCCVRCGEVLEPERLAFMDTVQIKGNGIRMSIPARWCGDCIKNDPVTSRHTTKNEPAEEWDVQP